jgi:hypothetical protein
MKSKHDRKGHLLLKRAASPGLHNLLTVNSNILALLIVNSDLSVEGKRELPNEFLFKRAHNHC